MALPGDVSTFSLNFGVYTDASGAVALVGAKGKLFPVDPVKGKRLNLVHIATGQEIIPNDLTVTIGSDGTASVGPIPHTDNPGLSTVGFAYRVEWAIASSKPSPGNLTFAAPAAAGATVDYDLLTPAEAVPGVAVPVGEGPQGDKGDPGSLYPVVVHGDDPNVARPVSADPVIWFGSVDPLNADDTKDVTVPLGDDAGQFTIAVSDPAVAALVSGASATATALRAAFPTKAAPAFTAMPEVNDGTGRDKAVDVVPGGATLAMWSAKLAGPGRLFHLTTGAGVGDTGTRDAIGIGVDNGGNGILISVKGGSGRIGKGLNTALQADAVAGSNALAVGQYNAVSPAASFETYSATHAPVLQILSIDAAPGQRMFRVQTAAAGVYTTREYIDSQTGVHVFSAQPDLEAGAKVRNTLDATVATLDQPILKGKVVAAQTANFIEFFNSTSTGYLFNVTAAGRVLATRAALNTGGTTGGGTLSVNGEGATIANAIFRAHATTPGDLSQWTDSASAVLSRIHKAGAFVTKVSTAPADADLANGEAAIYVDPTAGASALKVKIKDSAGAVTTKTLAA